ncbi:hypothetical protein IFM89_010476 [Coptis chinensis]|uniref:Uncharacterized protein n=1 Tax=Coptis chinensis TaxID=261450 RepID=A0A835IAA4_9MAGN|nr:hypothetical protein IFM89_010476 [Coptis chinensis]
MGASGKCLKSIVGVKKPEKDDQEKVSGNKNKNWKLWRSSSGDLSTGWKRVVRQEWVAIRIQTAFHGFLVILELGKLWKVVGFRLKDRVATLSLDEAELNEMKARSQHDIKKTLNWWDLIWFGIGVVIGSEIFALIG